MQNIYNLKRVVKKVCQNIAFSMEFVESLWISWVLRRDDLWRHPEILRSISVSGGLWYSYVLPRFPRARKFKIICVRRRIYLMCQSSETWVTYYRCVHDQLGDWGHCHQCVSTQLRTLVSTTSYGQNSKQDFE